VGVIPRSQRTASFLYLRSPRELILIAGSLPRLPQRLMVRGDTRNRPATSRTVNKSGRSSSLISFLIIVYGLIEFARLCGVTLLVNPTQRYTYSNKVIQMLSIGKWSRQWC